MTERRCKDCDGDWTKNGREGVRPGKPRAAPYPGPRCHSHHVLKRRADSLKAHSRRIEQTYGITAEQYEALKAAQGGKCWVCKRAQGKKRRLAVDHDHALAELHPHPTEQACVDCVRGLACAWCNHEVLGRLGDDPATYERIASLLRVPPAVQVIRPTAPASLTG